MVDPAASSLLPQSQSSSIETDMMVGAGQCTSSVITLLQSVITAFAWAFDGQQAFITIFTDAQPEWKCLYPADPICTQASSPCVLQPGSWSWTLPSDTSTVSEWGLQCANPVLLSLPASAFFAGCLVGGFFLSTLADSVLGRKMLLFLSCVVMSLAGVMTVLSPNLWIYSALKFICGLGRASVTTAALVLSMEIANQRWRDKVGVLGFVFYMSGFLSLPIMAYIGRGLSWRFLYLWTNIPSFFYAILLYYSVPESPRWLQVCSRNENDARLSKHDQQNSSADHESHNFFASMEILCRTRWILVRVIAVMTASFGVSIAYYGMPFSVQNLGTNLYSSTALYALSELPASLLTLLLTSTTGRRNSIITLTTLSGVLSLACAFEIASVGKNIQLAAEVTSYCGACTAFNLLLIYSAELFPTTVRNTAIGLVREAGLLAAVFAPILAAKGENNRFWSFGLFGLAIMLCGLACTCLPETKGRDLINHVDEDESNYHSTVLA